MNDLDLMQKFRAEVPPADPGSLADARAGMFREARPKRPRLVWRLAPVAALAVTVAAGVTVVALRDGDAPPPSPEAARVLRLAAAEVRRDKPLTARPDQFVYVRSRAAYAGGTTENGVERYLPPVEKERRLWLSVDGSKAGLVRSEPVRPGSGGTAKQSPAEAGHPAYLGDLPTEAADMRAWLYRGSEKIEKDGGNPADVTAFMKVGDTLREQYVPPASTAALFEAAATIPGTSVVERVDLTGRPGVAVSQTHHAARTDLIFDATSYRYLGEREVAQHDADPFPDGAVVGWSAQLQVAIVDRVGQVP